MPEMQTLGQSPVGHGCVSESIVVVLRNRRSGGIDIRNDVPHAIVNRHIHNAIYFDIQQRPDPAIRIQRPGIVPAPEILDLARRPVETLNALNYQVPPVVDERVDGFRRGLAHPPPLCIVVVADDFDAVRANRLQPSADIVGQLQLPERSQSTVVGVCNGVHARSGVLVQ